MSQKQPLTSGKCPCRESTERNTTVKVLQQITVAPAALQSNMKPLFLHHLDLPGTLTDLIFRFIRLNYWPSLKAAHVYRSGIEAIHTFPGQKNQQTFACLDRPHPRVGVLDVDNLSGVGNVEKLCQAVALPHWFPWRSETE